MADNFNFKQFLVENKLGSYTKIGNLNENEIAEDEAKQLMMNKDEDGAYDLLTVQYYYTPQEANAAIDKIANELSSDKAPYDPADDETTGFGAPSGPIDEGTAYGRVISNLGMLEDYLDQLLRNTATNSNIPTEDKQGLLYAFKEMKDLVLEIGSDVEQEDDGE
jgi:hypothetical protein